GFVAAGRRHAPFPSARILRRPPKSCPLGFRRRLNGGGLLTVGFRATMADSGRPLEAPNTRSLLTQRLVDPMLDLSIQLIRYSDGVQLRSAVLKPDVTKIAAGLAYYE